jgi:hypothetical protein
MSRSALLKAPSWFEGSGDKTKRDAEYVAYRRRALEHIERNYVASYEGTVRRFNELYPTMPPEEQDEYKERIDDVLKSFRAQLLQIRCSPFYSIEND